MEENAYIMIVTMKFFLTPSTLLDGITKDMCLILLSVMIHKQPGPTFKPHLVDNRHTLIKAVH
eukprot:8571030-Ditylum_brightwellii.AAC.2